MIPKKNGVECTMFKVYSKDYIKIAEKYIKKARNSNLYMSYMQKMLLHEAMQKDTEVRNLLKENEDLRNAYSGKRCFVLGNGPSLNEIDFSRLKNEVVFTVNQLPAHPNFKDLNSNFHIIIDLRAFGLRYGEEEDAPGFAKYCMELMKEMSEQGDPVLIVPYQVKRILERERVPEKLRTKYIYFSTEKFIDGYQHCELTVPIPDFSCVILVAILCAIYMGFSQIYLMGCDQTCILDILECGLGNSTKYGHAQDDDVEGDTLAYRTMIESTSIDRYLYGEYETHEGYKALYSFARKRRIKMYNLSSTTLIDSIPRRNIEDIL